MESLHNNDFASADSLLHKSLQILKLSKPSEALFKLKTVTLNNLGCLYKRLEDYSKALHYLTLALEISKNISSDVSNKAGTHLNISAIKSALNQHEQALHHALLGIKILQQGKKEFFGSLAVAYHAAGIEYQFLNMPLKAMNYFDRGYELSSQKLGKNHQITRSLEAAVKDFHGFRGNSELKKMNKFINEENKGTVLSNYAKIDASLSKPAKFDKERNKILRSENKVKGRFSTNNSLSQPFQRNLNFSLENKNVQSRQKSLFDNKPFINRRIYKKFSKILDLKMKNDEEASQESQNVGEEFAFESKFKEFLINTKFDEENIEKDENIQKIEKHEKIEKNIEIVEKIEKLEKNEKIEKHEKNEKIEIVEKIEKHENIENIEKLENQDINLKKENFVHQKNSSVKIPLGRNKRSNKMKSRNKSSFEESFSKSQENESFDAKSDTEYQKTRSIKSQNEILSILANNTEQDNKLSEIQNSNHRSDEALSKTSSKSIESDPINEKTTEVVINQEKLEKVENSLQKLEEKLENFSKNCKKVLESDDSLSETSEPTKMTRETAAKIIQKNFRA